MVARGRLPAWLSYLDHTADEGIVVRASDPAELYARAAWGLFSIITDLETVRPSETRAVAVEATDRHSLMVRWLSELNFLHQCRQCLLCTFDVEHWEERRMSATVAGEPIESGRHPVHKEVKAVTYHLLEVTQDGDGWRATVLFDV